MLNFDHLEPANQDTVTTFGHFHEKVAKNGLTYNTACNSTRKSPVSSQKLFFVHLIALVYTRGIIWIENFVDLKSCENASRSVRTLQQITWLHIHRGVDWPFYCCTGVLPIIYLVSVLGWSHSHCTKITWISSTHQMGVLWSKLIRFTCTVCSYATRG